MSNVIKIINENVPQVTWLSRFGIQTSVSANNLIMNNYSIIIGYLVLYLMSNQIKNLGLNECVIRPSTPNRTLFI